jgi:hypothetical protein
MLVEVWYKDELVEMNEQLMDEMERKVDAMDQDYCNYVLSCEWHDGHLCFYPNGPWEC